jgi:hypothetical protein
MLIGTPRGPFVGIIAGHVDDGKSVLILWQFATFRSAPSTSTHRTPDWARRLYFGNNAVTICDRNRFAGCESDEVF